MPERFCFEFAKLMTQCYSVRDLISFLITVARAVRYSSLHIKMPAIQTVIIIPTLGKTSYLRRLPYHINWILLQGSVSANHRNVFCHSLCNDQAVKRIAVMKWKFGICCKMR